MPLSPTSHATEAILPVWGISLGNTRCIVAAKTKTAAARAFNCSMHTFNQYASDSGNEDDIRTANSKPGQVFLRPIDHRTEGGWVEVDAWETTI